MHGKAIVRYINPWTLKRDRQRQRVAELRQRDGDNCRRCRRPMRFDLPPGTDLAPTLVDLGCRPGGPGPKGRAPSKSGPGALANLCLCHVRCNGVTVDATPEVIERMRLRAEESVAPKKRVAGRR